MPEPGKPQNLIIFILLLVQFIFPLNAGALAPNAVGLQVASTPAGPCSMPCRTGYLMSHRRSLSGKLVSIAGYVIKKEPGYVIFSDESIDKPNPNDLPVSGDKALDMLPLHKYVLSGILIRGGLQASNRNLYHFELASDPSLAPANLKDMEPFAEPISDSLNRITKKTFGLKVSPQNSPVTPERFSGYHTGVDFETTAEEKDKDISVNAICQGKVVFKSWVKGYGGVAVQKCDKVNVTVVYGHLKLSNVVSSGKKLMPGGLVGILGRGFSHETDFERKHLHLGIHLGSRIDLRGYVKNKKELDNWFDFTKFFTHEK